MCRDSRQHSGEPHSTGPGRATRFCCIFSVVAEGNLKDGDSLQRAWSKARFSHRFPKEKLALNYKVDHTSDLTSEVWP